MSFLIGRYVIQTVVLNRPADHGTRACSVENDIRSGQPTQTSDLYCSGKIKEDSQIMGKIRITQEAIR